MCLFSSSSVYLEPLGGAKKTIFFTLCYDFYSFPFLLALLSRQLFWSNYVLVCCCSCPRFSCSYSFPEPLTQDLIQVGTNIFWLKGSKLVLIKDHTPFKWRIIASTKITMAAFHNVLLQRHWTSPKQTWHNAFLKEMKTNLFIVLKMFSYSLKVHFVNECFSRWVMSFW